MEDIKNNNLENEEIEMSDIPDNETEEMSEISDNETGEMSEDVENLVDSKIIENLNQKYGDLTSLKIDIDERFGSGTIDNACKILSYIYMNYRHSKAHLIKGINGLITDLYSDEDIDANFYQDYVLIINESYKKCLLNYTNDFEKHLFDLSILVNLDFENKDKCILKCYMELKTICRKLYFATSKSYRDYQRIVDKDIQEREELYLLKFLDGRYREIYNHICELGDYLFPYFDEYDHIFLNFSYSMYWDEL